jgi:hypothetical protein
MLNLYSPVSTREPGMPYDAVPVLAGRAGLFKIRFYFPRPLGALLWDLAGVAAFKHRCGRALGV